MKKLKLIACLCALLFCGVVFAACDDSSTSKPTIPNKNFFETLVEVDPNSCVVTYDGQPHGLDISYPNVDVTATYSLSQNGTYVPVEELATVNVAEYDVYYQLNAKGYNTFTSPTPVRLTILQRELRLIILEDSLFIKSSSSQDIKLNYSLANMVGNDDLGLEFDYIDENNQPMNKDQVQYREKYKIVPSISNGNYRLVEVGGGYLKIADYAQITKSETTNYYPTLEAAIEAAQDGDEIVINETINVESQILVNKNVTINGVNGKRIQATSGFTATTYGGKQLASIFTITENAGNLTLKNLTIDGGTFARCASVFNGSLTVDASILTNGKRTDEYRSGGVYLANAGTLTVAGNSTVAGNNGAEETYLQYGSDVWVDTSTAGSTISLRGGSIGNVFVNANSASSADAGKLVVDGASITNVYLEYVDSYAAKCTFTSGTIKNLMLSTTSGAGANNTVVAVVGTTYTAGVVA